MGRCGEYRARPEAPQSEKANAKTTRWRLAARDVGKLSTLLVGAGRPGFRREECRRDDLRVLHECRARCSAPVTSLRVVSLKKFLSEQIRNFRYWEAQQRSRPTGCGRTRPDGRVPLSTRCGHSRRSGFGKARHRCSKQCVTGGEQGWRMIDQGNAPTRWPTGLDLFKDPDDQFLAELRLLHAELLGWELYFQLARTS